MCGEQPVFIGHSSINIEFDSPMDEKEASEILSNSKGISVIDHRKDEGYVTPVRNSWRRYEVYISRIEMMNP